MPNQTEDIAARLEQAGLDDFSIDWERGIALVYFPAENGTPPEQKPVISCESNES